MTAPLNADVVLAYLVATPRQRLSFKIQLHCSGICNFEL